MKKIIPGFIALLALVFFISSKAPEFVKERVPLTGTWNLNAYGYNKRGMMQFSFVQNTKYVFEEDLSGKVLVNDSVTAAFSWVLRKKNLTLTFTGEEKQYLISQHTATDLIIVDRAAGTDENRTYEAYEKGLMFKK
jgi:hypothetical protein